MRATSMERSDTASREGGPDAGLITFPYLCASFKTVGWLGFKDGRGAHLTVKVQRKKLVAAVVGRMGTLVGVLLEGGGWGGNGKEQLFQKTVSRRLVGGGGAFCRPEEGRQFRGTF